jgi:DNA-binding transcriptional LysR family regulator
MQTVNARVQYKPAADDLALVLALVRGGTLADAAQRLHVDTSTVFRAVQRLEKRLAQRLFERTRRGYLAGETALALAAHAERIEAEIEAARGALQRGMDEASGLVRVSTTDTFLQDLVLPALSPLLEAHPMLRVDVTATNELVSLTRRDADIALRVTRRPPGHVVGRRLGIVRVAVYGAPRLVSRDTRPLDAWRWIAPDEGLPEHPTVRWRRRTYPKLAPALLLNTIGAVADAIELGLGIGALPILLAQRHTGLKELSEPLPDCESELWLLTHPESRHLRRIAAVAEHFARTIELP